MPEPLLSSDILTRIVPLEPPPRLTGEREADARALANWAYKFYVSLLTFISQDTDPRIKRLEDVLTRISELPPLDGSAPLADVIAKVNAISALAGLPDLE